MNLSPELCSYAMLRIFCAYFGNVSYATFEDIVDVYPVKQLQKKLSFSVSKVSKILGVTISINEVKDILRRYNFEYKNDGDHI